jgi:non-canonical poly(A) RNA polymerase PAPD5/7
MHPKLRRNEIDPMKHLGQLFMEFFELYGSRFNSEHVGISLRDGGQYFSKQGRGWVSGGQYGSNRDQRQKFSIEDPQDISE